MTRSPYHDFLKDVYDQNGVIVFEQYWYEELKKYEPLHTCLQYGFVQVLTPYKLSVDVEITIEGLWELHLKKLRDNDGRHQ